MAADGAEPNLNEPKVEEGEDETPGELYGYQAKSYNQTNKKPQSITLKLIMDRNLNKTVTYEDSKLKMLNRLQVISSASSSKPRTPSNRLPALKRESSLLAKDALVSVDDSVSLESTNGGDQPLPGNSTINEKVKSLFKLTHIHLDREAITEIDNLAEYLGSVTNLYLHHNLIKKIENLDFLKTLKFLILSHNQIKRIENLRGLANLKLLDLSYNSIDVIEDAKELPPSIVFLDLRENPVVKSAIWMSDDYEGKLESALPSLRQLNGEDLMSASGDEEDFSALDSLDQDESGCHDDVSQTACMMLPRRDYYLSRPEVNMESITEEILNRSRQRQKSFLVDSEKTLRERQGLLESAKKSMRDKLEKNSAQDSAMSLKIKNMLYTKK